MNLSFSNFQTVPQKIVLQLQLVSLDNFHFMSRHVQLVSAAFDMQALISMANLINK